MRVRLRGNEDRARAGRRGRARGGARQRGRWAGRNRRRAYCRAAMPIRSCSPTCWPGVYERSRRARVALPPNAKANRSGAVRAAPVRSIYSPYFFTSAVFHLFPLLAGASGIVGQIQISIVMAVPTVRRACCSPADLGLRRPRCRTRQRRLPAVGVGGRGYCGAGTRFGFLDDPRGRRPDGGGQQPDHSDGRFASRFRACAASMPTTEKSGCGDRSCSLPSRIAVGWLVGHSGPEADHRRSPAGARRLRSPRCRRWRRRASGRGAICPSAA